MRDVGRHTVAGGHPAYALLVGHLEPHHQVPASAQLLALGEDAVDEEDAVLGDGLGRLLEVGIRGQVVVTAAVRRPGTGAPGVQQVATQGVVVEGPRPHGLSGPPLRVAMGARVVEVVDRGANDDPVTLDEQGRELVGEPGLPRTVAAVDSHQERPVEVGQRVGDAGEDREPFGGHSSWPRTWAPPGGRRTMKSHTSPWPTSTSRISRNASVWMGLMSSGPATSG